MIPAEVEIVASQPLKPDFLAAANSQFFLCKGLGVRRSIGAKIKTIGHLIAVANSLSQEAICISKTSYWSDLC